MLGDEAFLEIVRRAVGRRPVRVHGVARSTGGNTATRRAIVEFRDGTTLFVKLASDPKTKAWLRAEHQVYATVRAPFLPSLHGWYEGTGVAVVALDDLSDARWPPPWHAGDVEAVMVALDAVHATSPPEGTPGLREMFEGVANWDAVARAPSGFLDLGLCTEAWFDRAVKTLSRVAAAAPLDGRALLHLDVRSDNLCFAASGQAVLVDWNWASVGNPDVDAIWWLPSLCVEGGPPPWDVFPEARPELVAWLAGYLAANVPGAPLAAGSRVREMQLDQLRVALPWAARTAGLEAPERA